MIQTKKKSVTLCIQDDCTILCSFNCPDEKRAIYYKTHKKDGMINVKKAKMTCQHKDYTLRSGFNVKGVKTSKFCSQHKKSGMVNVTHKTRDFEDCKILPNFNFPGSIGGIRCRDHIKPGMMIAIGQKKMCIQRL